MTIGSVAGQTGAVQSGSGIGVQTDAYSKSIQNQIANAKKELQELSANEELSVEEKLEKKQQLQQEIASLNQQLRQHQIEQRREQQQSRGSSMDDMLGTKQRAGQSGANKKGSGISQESMKTMISADSSLKQAAVSESVATTMQGRAGVLEGEIKQDQGRGQSRGQSTEKKEAELADVQERAVDARSAQITSLADANRTLSEAAETYKKDGRTKDDRIENGQSKSDQRTDDPVKETDGGEAGEQQTALPEGYVSVDIRL